MVDEECTHEIFLVNPLELLKYVGRFMKIILENGEVLSGTVYTIDPVSQSIVLIVKEPSEELTVNFVMKHSINSMEMTSETQVEDLQKISENIFNSSQFSSKECNSKEDVKHWLEKNMIPVIENGDKLVIDSLEIHPPYGVAQCYSSNSIVLTKVQKLLKQMPKKENL